MRKDTVYIRRHKGTNPPEDPNEKYDKPECNVCGKDYDWSSEIDDPTAWTCNSCMTDTKNET